MLRHRLGLDQGHGRVAAAEGQRADLQKGEKQLKINHFLAPFLSRRRVCTAPKAAVTRMIQTTLIFRK